MKKIILNETQINLLSENVFSNIASSVKNIFSRQQTPAPNQQVNAQQQQQQNVDPFKADGWSKKPIQGTVWLPSEAGKTMIKQFETINGTPNLTIYYATAKEKRKGIKTIGWGHVIKNHEKPQIAKILNSGRKEITPQEADYIFDLDVKEFSNYVAIIFKQLPDGLNNASAYPQGFIDAVISLMFNCGPGNFTKTPLWQTLLNSRFNPQTNMIKKDDYSVVCNALRNSAISEPGHKHRRQDEFNMAWRNQYLKSY